MYGTVSILNYALILYSTVYLRLAIVNTTVLLTLLSAKGLAKATVAYTMLTLVIRVGALNAPAAGVDMTRAIRALGVVAHRPSALGRGVCWCRWVSLVIIRTKDCCVSRRQRMVVQLFCQSMLDVFQASDLHLKKSLCD